MDRSEAPADPLPTGEKDAPRRGPDGRAPKVSEGGGSLRKSRSRHIGSRPVAFSTRSKYQLRSAAHGGRGLPPADAGNRRPCNAPRPLVMRAAAVEKRPPQRLTTSGLFAQTISQSQGLQRAHGHPLAVDRIEAAQGVAGNEQPFGKPRRAARIAGADGRDTGKEPRDPAASQFATNRRPRNRSSWRANSRKPPSSIRRIISQAAHERDDPPVAFHAEDHPRLGAHRRARVDRQRFPIPQRRLIEAGGVSDTDCDRNLLPAGQSHRFPAILASRCYGRSRPRPDRSSSAPASDGMLFARSLGEHSDDARSVGIQLQTDRPALLHDFHGGNGRQARSQVLLQKRPCLGMNQQRLERPLFPDAVLEPGALRRGEIHRHTARWTSSLKNPGYNVSIASAPLRRSR